jgi:hypothetical protein
MTGIVKIYSPQGEQLNVHSVDVSGWEDIGWTTSPPEPKKKRSTKKTKLEE